MITLEQISQRLCDILKDFNLIKPETYEYEGLKAFLKELTQTED